MSRPELVLLIGRLRSLADQHEQAAEDDDAADTGDTLCVAMSREWLLDPRLLREAADALGEHVA